MNEEKTLEELNKEWDEETVADEVVVCDYNKLGFKDGCKLIGRSIRQNAKKVAIGAGVVTAVGVGALVAHALKKHDDDGNNDVIDGTAHEIDVYEDPEVSHAYDNYYDAAEKLDEAISEFNNSETVSQETTEE